MDGVLVLFVSLTGNLIKIGQYESTREHRTDKKKSDQLKELIFQHVSVVCVCVRVCGKVRLCVFCTCAIFLTSDHTKYFNPISFVFT